MSQSEELAARAREAPDFVTGLDLADRLYQLHQEGAEDPALLQERFCEILVDLAQKAETRAQSGQVRDRLLKTPFFRENQEIREAYARSLAVSAGNCELTEHGLIIALKINEIDGFSDSLAMQEAKADALFRSTAREATSEQLRQAASRILELGALNQSLEIQQAAAKTLCNATGSVRTPQEAQELILQLQSLPHQEDSVIQEALRRSRHNLDRLNERAAERNRSYRQFLVGAAKLLVVVALIGGILWGAPKVLAALFLSAPESEGPETSNRVYAVQEEAAEKAIAAGDLEEAVAHLKVVRRVAARNHDTDAEQFYSEKLVGLYEQLGQWDKAKAYLLRLGPEDQQAAVQRFREAAFQLSEKKEFEQNHLCLESLIELEENLGQSPLGSRLQLAAVKLKMGDRSGALKMVQDFDAKEVDHPDLKVLKQALAQTLLEEAKVELRAARFEEASPLLEQAVSLGAFPGDAKKAKLEQGMEFLKQAEQLVQEESYEKAIASAQASEVLLVGSQAEIARAKTVQAKCAFLTGNYGDAAALANKAVALQPDNKEYKQRRDSYRNKDLEHVDRSELISGRFEFPPATKRSDGKIGTSIYLLSSHENERAGRGQELHFGGKDDIKATMSYGDKPKNLNITVETYAGERYYFSFQSPSNRLLRPGTFRVPAETKFGQPTFSFSSSNGSVYGANGVFIIREFRIKKKKISKYSSHMQATLDGCAVDFYMKGRNDSYPVYGKLRYRSKYQ